jgi:membrane protein required for colicin V production
LLKMVLILSVSLNFFLKINSTNLFAEKKTLDESVFFYPVLSVSNLIFPVLEEWFKEYKQK